MIGVVSRKNGATARLRRIGDASGLLVLVAVLAIVAPARTAGQAADAAERLAEIETMAAIGRTAEARRELEAWWRNDRADAPRRIAERALWLRGRLATDPAMAARDFRRLVAEYPTGPYADLALLRLAQGARAAGDTDAERQYLESLARSYPGSPGHEASLAWLRGEEATIESRFEPLPPPPDLPIVQPRSRAQETDEEESSRSDEDEVEARPYAVQLGAFRNRDGAESLRRRAVNGGLEARIVRLPGSSLLRVRVGRFTSSAEADRERERAVGLGFSAAVVDDANQERGS